MIAGFYCDKHRHLVCVPYSVAALHAMAMQLGIKRCWFHASASYAHYDLPQTAVARIKVDPRVTVVPSRTILAIVKSAA